MAARSQWYGLGLYNPATVYMRDFAAATGKGQPCNFGVYGKVVTAANLDARVALFETAPSGLVPTVQALTLGLITAWQYAWLHVSDLGNGATSPLAQRENKLLISYQDVTTQKSYRAELPTIDLSKLTFTYKNFVDKAVGTEVIAFVAAFEAFAVAPITGNDVEITQLEFVGRRS